MIADPPVLTIRREIDRIDPQQVAKFAGAETVHIVDAMDRHGALLVGDRDGVVVVPRSEAESVAARLESVRSAESDFEADAANGLHIPDFIQALLQSERVRDLD